MPDVMKTLLLNPPSFENFDGGASSRWPATREIESYWYPVWLTYPAGMIPGSRLLDACPHKVNWQETVQICKDYEFLILFTSAVGFESDVKLIRTLKEIMGVSYRQDGRIVHNAPRPQLHTEELDALPFATEIYKRDLEIERYNVPFLLHPYISFYTTRGCPAL